jgi:hypothetical protein
MKLYWIVWGGTLEVIRAESPERAADVLGVSPDQRAEALAKLVEISVDGPAEIVISHL